jgi:hypothetical protein
LQNGDKLFSALYSSRSAEEFNEELLTAVKDFELRRINFDAGGQKNFLYLVERGDIQGIRMALQNVEKMLAEGIYTPFCDYLKLKIQ